MVLVLVGDSTITKFLLIINRLCGELVLWLMSFPRKRLQNYNKYFNGANSCLLFSGRRREKLRMGVGWGRLDVGIGVAAEWLNVSVMYRLCIGNVSVMYRLC